MKTINFKPKDSRNSMNLKQNKEKNFLKKEAKKNHNEIEKIPPP